MLGFHGHGGPHRPAALEGRFWGSESRIESRNPRDSAGPIVGIIPGYDQNVRLSRRIGVVGFAIGALLVVGSATATARLMTQTTIFEPFNPDGSPTLHVKNASGYCWTGSLATRRRDAWRCFKGNYILDPCFSSSSAPGVVLCPNMGVIGGIELHLTRPLPRQAANTGRPSLSNHPWGIQLSSGRNCVFLTGATTLVAGQRLNYGCAGPGPDGLWGLPRRRAQPWTILVAPFNATGLNQRATIRHAWM
jgi:hypothetical protein